MRWSSRVGGCDPPTAFSKRATPPIIYPAISSALGVMKKHPFLLEIPFSANNLFSWLPAASRQRSARSPLPLCTNKELAAERARAAGRRGNALHAATTAESTASSSQRASPQHPNSQDPPHLAPGLLHAAGGIPRAGSSLHTPNSLRSSRAAGVTSNPHVAPGNQRLFTLALAPRCSLPWLAYL